MKYIVHKLILSSVDIDIAYVAAIYYIYIYNNINIHPGLYISDGILEFYVKKYYDFMKHFK